MKNWLKRTLPAPRRILENRQLGVFGTLLHDPNLWHINRRSVAGGVAVGLFMAIFLWPAGHMLIAAGLAIWFRVNLPISVLLVWATNPLTTPPLWWAAWLLGSWLLGTDTGEFDHEVLLDWHAWVDWHNWLDVLGPLALGCLILAILSAALGWAAVHLVWRWRLVRQIRARRARYRAMTASRVSNPSSSRQR